MQNIFRNARCVYVSHTVRAARQNDRARIYFGKFVASRMKRHNFAINTTFAPRRAISWVTCDPNRQSAVDPCLDPCPVILRRFSRWRYRSQGRHRQCCAPFPPERRACRPRRNCFANLAKPLKRRFSYNHIAKLEASRVCNTSPSRMTGSFANLCSPVADLRPCRPVNAEPAREQMHGHCGVGHQRKVQPRIGFGIALGGNVVFRLDDQIHRQALIRIRTANAEAGMKSMNKNGIRVLDTYISTFQRQNHGPVRRIMAQNIPSVSVLCGSSRITP